MYIYNIHLLSFARKEKKKNRLVCNLALKMTNKHREKYNFRVVLFRDIEL